MSATLKLCENPGIYNDYENQIDFDTIELQTSFWNSKVVSTFSDLQFSFVNTNTIKILGNYNNMKSASYCFVDSTINNTSKRYYYFITDIKLLAYGQNAVDNNDDTIQLELEEDVFQTYMFDYEIKESFIEREHQDRYDGVKRIFSRTPENFNYEKYFESEEKLKDGDNPCQYVVAVFSENTPGVDGFPIIETSGNTRLQNGFHYYIFPIIKNSSIAPEINVGSDTFKFCSINYFFNKFGNDPTLYQVFLIPYFKSSLFSFKEMVGTKPVFNSITTNWVYYYGTPPFTNLNNQIMIYLGQIFPYEIELSSLGVSLPSFSITTGDKVKTNESKLFNFQFRHFSLTNYHNNDNEIDYSFFNNEKPYYNITLGDTPKAKLYLKNYRNDNSGNIYNSIDETFGYADLKTSKWLDYCYNNKATMKSGLQSKVLFGLGKSAISAVGGAVAGGITGNPAGAIAGSVTGLAQGLLNTGQMIDETKRSWHDLQQAPDSVRSGGNSYEFDLINDYNSYYCRKFSILEKNENIVYDYLYAYGYKCDEIKIPNLKSRYYFNYIRIFKANILGELNIKKINILQNIYRNGITIWHYRNSETFLINDYSKENIEMSLL